MAQIIAPTVAGGAAAALPALAPEELAPHFPQLEILECLGRGGMGVVYKARQKSLNRLVALKLLAPERADDPQFAVRFEKEAHALAALNHPNIVGVYDFGQAGGFYFLLMEFVDGVNLRQLLQTKRLTPKEALSIVPPVCEALQCAHDHGIVHRDIKPENLLMDKAGMVKIADFGIAKIVGDSEPADGTPRTDGTMAQGTPDYAAPEQQNSTIATDHRADIYSLGVVLYEMLTGERPQQDFVPPSKRVQVDIRIDAIVLRALEKTPELRFQTAADFRTQVEAIGDAAAAIPAAPQAEYITSWGVRITPGPAVKTGYTRFWEHLFGSIESTGAIHTLNFSRLGFGGFGVFLATFSGLRWMWPVFGALGMFGLIGVAYISEAASRCGVDLSKNDGADDVKAARAVWRRRIFWSIVWGIIMPIAFFALSFIFSLANGGEEAIEAATTDQMLMILVKVFGTGVGFTFSAWALLRMFWKKPSHAADQWPRYPESLVAVAGFGPSMLLATPFFIWEFVSAARAQATLTRMSGDFAHRNIGEWILLVLTVLIVLQGAVWVTRNLRQTLRVMNGEGNGSALEPQVESATPNAADDDTPEPVSVFEYAWRVVPIIAIVLALFNPWGRNAWMWFGFGCAVLALAPPLFDRTPKLRRRRSETKQKQSRWQGWDVWAIGLCLVVFGSLSLLQLSEGPLLNRSLFVGAGAGSNVVLPVALATTILLAGVAFLYMLARNLKTDAPTRAVSWKRKLGRSVVPTIAVILLLRTFVLAPFWSVTDAAGPEIPKGSLVLVWKLTRNFAPGDIIAYADESNGHVSLGRIDKQSQEAVFVKRKNCELTSVLHSAIVGKVISVVWRGTPQASVPATIEKSAALNRSGPVFPYTISGRTTGGKPLEVGGFADIIVTMHGADPSRSEVLPIVRGAKVAKITDNDSSISNYRLVELELELTRAEIALIKQHEHRGSFSFAPVEAPLESEKRPKPENIPRVPTTAGAVDSQLPEKPSVKLIRIEERGKTRDGRDMVMIFEELQRDEKTSIVTIKAVNGGSVGSAMFMVQGASDIANARGAACFINLKEWEGKDGAWMYLIGFAPDKGVDPITYFELKEPLSAEKRNQFLSVKDYEPLFNRQP